MFKTSLAIIGAGFLVYHACMGYSRHIEKKYKSDAFDAMKKAYANSTAAQKENSMDAVTPAAA